MKNEKRKTETRSISHSLWGIHLRFIRTEVQILLLFQYILSSDWENTLKYTCDVSPLWIALRHSQFKYYYLNSFQLQLQSFLLSCDLTNSFFFFLTKMKLLLFPRINVLSWYKFHPKMFIYAFFQAKSILIYSRQCCLFSFVSFDTMVILLLYV